VKHYLLFNKLNVRFKRVWKIDDQDDNKLASTEFLPLVVNEQLVDFNFAYFLLISDSLTDYLCGQNSNTSGSHKRIDPNVLLNMDIILPNRSEQERIGSFLSEIDDKIALNREINRNLPPEA
jgi:type I restriction enzyme S subunit